MTQPDPYLLRLLRAQSHQLAREISLMPADAVLWKPAPAEWSVHECLSHVRDIERNVFLVRISRVVKEDRPALPNFDEAAYQRDHWNAAEPVRDLLADFVADRASEVALLETADWARTGDHEVRGPLTLDWLATYTVNHTWEHLSQIMRVRLNYLVRQ